MPSVINPLPTLRVCAFRPHPPIRPAARVAFAIKPPACRSLTEDKSTDLPKAPEGTAEPNMHQQEHVSEEAAKIAKVQGGEGPDIEGQGTPVQEVSSPFNLVTSTRRRDLLTRSCRFSAMKKKRGNRLRR